MSKLRGSVLDQRHRQSITRARPHGSEWRTGRATRVSLAGPGRTRHESLNLGIARIVSVALAALIASMVLSPSRGGTAPRSMLRGTLPTSLATQSPVAFEPWGAAYVARTPAYGAILDSRGIGLLLKDGGRARIDFVGAREVAEVRATEPNTGVSNYYVSPDRGGERAGVPRHSSLHIADIHDGVSLRYRTVHSAIAFDFIVAPNTNTNLIAIELGGGTTLEGGRLIYRTERGQVDISPPVAYQSDGRHVAAAFVQRSPGVFGVDLGPRDESKALTIDPTIEYSTLLGGSREDAAGGVGIDRDGNAYVVGTTTSMDFPTTSRAVQRQFKSDNPESQDGFVTKFSADGSRLIYSTYIGGKLEDFLTAIAVDEAGHAYVAGRTNSADFPTTAAAFQGELHGETDAVVAKLGDLGALEYSTFLGGGDYEWARGIDVDTDGNAYLAGETRSQDFPASPGAYMVRNPAKSEPAAAFVAKVKPDGGDLDFATYLGGTATQWGVAVAVGPDASVYVGGRTQSDDFPTTEGAVQREHRGESDAFALRLDPSGRQLIYSTLLGGSRPDAVYGIAVDSGANAYLTGIAQSPDFPTTQGAFGAVNENGGAYVTKLNSTGSALVYSTIIGGSKLDWGLAISVDSNGLASAVGSTASTDFPVTDDALMRTYPGGEASGYFVRLNASGSKADYATYLGGSSGANASGVASDDGGDVFVAGATRSGDLPITFGYSNDFRGEADAFLFKFNFSGREPRAAPPEEGSVSYLVLAAALAAIAVTVLVVAIIVRRRSADSTDS